MARGDDLSAASRDSHLALRRVERQQALTERLHTTCRGRGGGVSIPTTPALGPIAVDVPEAAALSASLAALGPSVSPSATSALHKLVAALQQGS
jgi:hypothetical protein